MSRLRSWWRGLLLKRKLAAAVVLALALFGTATVVGAATLCLIITRANAPGVLYSGMSADEAAMVRAELERMGEPYESTDDRIMVRTDRRDVVRMELANRHVTPKGGLAGTELIDGLYLVQLSPDHELGRQRGLQCELARAIRTIKGIADAKVLLAVPADSTTPAPTASVLLTLQPGATLSPGQLASIGQFVIHAVPRMSEENISIIDNRGMILYPIPTFRPSTTLAKERS